MKYIAVLSICFVCTQCLTMSLFPLSRSIKVESNPPSARAQLYDEGELVDEVFTPGRIYLFRVRNLTLKVSRPGYKTVTVPIRFKYSPVRLTIAGLMGCTCLLIPTGLDFLSGATEVPAQNVYTVTLEPEDGSEHSIELQVIATNKEIIIR